MDSVLYVGNFILRPGEPISQFYGFQYEGTWKGNQTAEAAEYAQVPGDPRYKDVNDDKIIGAEDLDVLGNPLPDFTWGWNTSIEYKNFDLNLLVNGAHGYQVWNFPGRIFALDLLHDTCSTLFYLKFHYIELYL